MQFVCIWFILLLVMDTGRGPALVFRNKLSVRIGGGLLIGFCLWLGTASYLYRSGRPEAAVKVYPGCTGAWITLLAQTEYVTEMEEIADEILSRNQSVSLAHSAKARAAYARGDFGAMIAYKEKAVSLARSELADYLDYFHML